MLMVLAALQMIPPEPLEAAHGSTAPAPWQVFRHVTLPFLRGVLLVAGLFRLIDSDEGLPADLHPDRRRAGHRDRGHQLLRVPAGLQLQPIGYSSAITVVVLAASIALSWLIVASSDGASSVD